MISHRNLLANFEQITSDYFLEYGKVAPPGTATVSWLPFYHDLGLILGICAPILAGVPGVFTSPVAFLQRPARWMQLLASNGHVFSAAPNFAFDLAARKTTDEDMAGLDLGDVLIIQNGAERVQPKTLRRFTERFAKFNLGDTVIRPSYGLAEATVYVATRAPAQRPQIVHFESEQTVRRPREAVRKRRRYAAHQLRRAAVADNPHRRSRVPVSSVPREPSVRSGCTARTSRWAIGRDLKRPKSTFGARLLASSVGTPRRALATNRGLGLLLRRRVVHRWPHQGSVNRLWAQPLSRRHRGDGPRDHAGTLRGDISSG